MNILFDLDGTLTDPREGIVACIQHAISRLGHPVPQAEGLERFIGPPLHDTFRELLPTCGVCDDVHMAVALFRERFSTVGLFENRVYEGIPEALHSLGSRGARLFIATSKPRVFAEQILDHFGLSSHFEAVYGSELDGTRADKRALVAHVLSESQLEASATTMVGDRKHDVIGALHNGVCPAGVLWGYGSKDELTEAGAKSLFDKPSELERLPLRVVR